MFGCMYICYRLTLDRLDFNKVGIEVVVSCFVLFTFETTYISGYEISSTGHELLVQFTANSNMPGQGFKARYQFQMEDNANEGLVKLLKTNLVCTNTFHRQSIEKTLTQAISLTPAIMHACGWCQNIIFFCSRFKSQYR